MIRSQLDKGKNKTWDAVKYLLDKCSDMNAKDKYGFNVVHHAVYRGNTLLVKSLLDEKGLKLEVMIMLKNEPDLN